ncbi:IbS toxin protein [Salmonella enterica subsp. enterica serovar Typhimurium var. monophasic 4,5,12:i:-]|nr:IbS toxin protein [Salmonella enterica subsp. enterica serovar Typhimurium var. monophasic 4,5,12:i:-]
MMRYVIMLLILLIIACPAY